MERISVLGSFLLATVLYVLCTTICGCQTPGVGDGSTPVRIETTPSGRTGSPNGNAATPPPSLASHTSFELRDLQQYAPSTGKSETERLQGLTAFLRQELKAPRTPVMGVGGGPIDSDYVLGVIIEIIGLYCTSDMIRTARAHQTDKELQRLLAISEVVSGDPTTTPLVRDLSLHHKNGGVRLAAIRALGKLKDQKNTDTLKTGLEDDYCRLVAPGPGRGGWTKHYPIRAEAVESLIALGRPKPPTTIDVPLTVSEPPALYAQLLADKDPSSCLSGVKLLIHVGHTGRSYLEAFVAENEVNAALRDSVSLARTSLE